VKDYPTGTTIYLKFGTQRPSTGASYALASGAVSVYKDDSTTQSTTGVTLTADFDSVTGLNHVAIDTSADGTFYSSGSDFQVVLTAGTVDSISVIGQVVGEFSLGKTSALRPTVAGRTLDVSAGGEAGIDWANVGSPTTAVGLTGTTISTSQAVASVSGAVGSVTGNVGGNVVGSVGSVSAAVTLPTIPTDWITATGIAASALNGKGNWLETTNDRPKLTAVYDKLPLRGYFVGTTVNSGAIASADMAAISDATWDDSLDEHDDVSKFGGFIQLLSTAASLATVAGNVSSILVKLTGITYLKNWLAAMFGKTADSGTLAEMTATTAGTTYDNATDSLQAIRDRGDNSWSGGGGGGGGTVTGASDAFLDQLRGIRFIGPTSVSSSPRQIVAGDDYSGTRALRFESDALPDLSGASSITFTMRATNRAATVALTATTVAYQEDPTRLEVTLTSTQTRLDPGWYDADIEAVVDSKKQTVVGPKVRFEVLEDQTR